MAAADAGAVTPPCSPLFSVLLLALPFGWRAARSFIWLYCPNPRRLDVLAPGLLLVWILFWTQTLGQLTGHFYAPLALSLCITAALGVWLQHKQTRALQSWRPPLRSAGWAVIAALVIIAPSVILFDYHDKVRFISGHIAMPNQILNDVYPPRNMTFPTLPWIYHYLVELLFASVAALLHLRVDLAVKLTTWLAWGYSAVMAAGLGRAVGLGRRSWLAVMILALGGGLPWLFLDHVPQTAPELLGEIRIYRGAFAALPIVSNLFQHPYTIGIPLFVAWVLLMTTLGHAAKRRGGWRARWVWMPSMIMALMSLAQAPMFVALLLGVAIHQTWVIVRTPTRKALADFAWLVLAPGFYALVSGGMLGTLVWMRLKRIAADAGVGMSDTQWLPSNLRIESPWTWSWTQDRLFWMLCSVGVLVFGAVTMVTRRYRRTFLMQALSGAAAISFLIPFFFYYEHSWDIVKFLQNFQLLMVIPLALLVRDLFSRREMKVAQGGAAVILVLAILPGVLHQLPFWTGRETGKASLGLHPRSLFMAPSMWTNLSDDEKAGMQFIREHVTLPEVTLCDEPLARSCAMFAGLPQAFIDGFAEQYLVPGGPPRFVRRKRLLHGLASAGADELRAEGICWVMFRDRDASLSSVEQRLAQQGYASAFSKGGVRVMHLCGEAP